MEEIAQNLERYKRYLFNQRRLALKFFQTLHLMLSFLKRDSQLSNSSKGDEAGGGEAG